jgi:CDGSH-type Zn-finger protein
MSEHESSGEPQIRVTLNGPYEAKNVQEFRNWLGEELSPKSEMDLCRCGESSTKPYCDGTMQK